MNPTQFAIFTMALGAAAIALAMLFALWAMAITFGDGGGDDE